MFILLKKMVRSVARGRAAHTPANYKEAINALNTLQSNAATIQAVKKHGSTGITNLRDIEKYLLRIGITPERLDALSVIHVAGTKGKGSTCAFTEAILRENGYSTGFYSSPHLVTVRERLRINGEPISESQFASHFWKVYKSLLEQREYEADMPPYFKFLTVLMFRIFLKANIDVAIIEVGIGGEYDCTNIVRNPVCVGITSLGMDHTRLLGDTLESIAYQKAGIFKSGAPAFTVPQQESALTVLKKRALERNCTLTIVPKFESYPWGASKPILRIGCKVQKYNASLAIQMAFSWIAAKIQTKNSPTINGNDVIETSKDSMIDEESLKCFFAHLSLEKTAAALSSCKWPGRTQILRGKIMDFYIDGAHTVESMEVCIGWFKEHVVVDEREKHYLVFNSTGDRDSGKLIEPLRALNFDRTYFVPNIAQTIGDSVDRQNFSVPTSDQMIRCQCHRQIWGNGSVIMNSVNDAFEDIRNECSLKASNENKVKAKVLITGSLHLVGAALALLDPELSMSTNY